MTMPMTYASDSAKRRERRPSLCMAKKPTVIGIIGKTHGVRFRASPPRKRIRSVSGRPCAAYVAESWSLPIGAAAGPFGAAESGVKLELVAGVAGGASNDKAEGMTKSSRGLLELMCHPLRILAVTTP